MKEREEPINEEKVEESGSGRETTLDEHYQPLETILHPSSLTQALTDLPMDFDSQSQFPSQFPFDTQILNSQSFYLNSQLQESQAQSPQPSQE